jgi:hypothetical protein
MEVLLHYSANVTMGLCYFCAAFELVLVVDQCTLFTLARMHYSVAHLQWAAHTALIHDHLIDTSIGEQYTYTTFDTRFTCNASAKQKQQAAKRKQQAYYCDTRIQIVENMPV